ncbi:homoserine kinase [Novispirillum itersonii]|uniref:Homoserine kinase n=1 Tax=Novispirillum itersonii TaxID=189 RepID=A0A7W9ZIH3_NOVIT|nr:homoserine kinase [Novispirillum itersonii]MBB6212091.1 homoserine kinase type II [Novispirillum itersonii]
MAVYTEVSDDDLDAFIAQYDIGTLESCKGIAEGVENSNFLLTTDRGPYILTLYEKRVNPDDLPFFLGLTEHLSANGFPCPLPVKARDGVALRELCGRPAAIISFLKGMWPRKISLSHCAQLGTALAKMHQAADGFTLTRANALSVSGWRPLFDLARDRADEVLPGLAAEIAAELDYLEAHWPTDLPHGVIHADVFPDNVFFLHDTLSGVIDFYFACNDLLAYDLAICLNAWCFEGDKTFNATKARLMINGYLKQRPMSDAELEALPLLCRGSAMRFLLTRLYDWLNTPSTAMVTRKDPLEYLHKLRFHRATPGPGAYGLG